MKYTVMVFGKTACNHTKAIEEEYQKRITPFAKTEYILLPEEKIRKGQSEEAVQKKEADTFFARYNSQSFLIACHGTGKTLSSPAFTQLLQKTALHFPSITFVVGGSLGLHSSVLQKANMQLSFSAMTFPHDLFRIFLWEQIYRSCMIASNRKYHR